VRAVELESAFVVQLFGQGVDELGVGVVDAAAGVADDVHVLVLGRPVRRGPMTEVGVPDEPDLLQQLQRPVDGGDVDAVHALADALRGGVAEGAHRGQHLLALRGQPQAAGPQLVGEVGGGPRRRRRGVVVGVHASIVGSVAAVDSSVDAVLAVLGVGLVDPATAVVRADDPGVTRGDGCFEGCRIVDGAVDKLDAHLARMARSAGALELPFAADEWRELVELAVGAWPHRGEAAMKLLLTRGPVGLAWITPLPADYPRLRREGLRLITLDRGTTFDAFTDAPWLLGGVKTLSYAVNMAAAREATRRGADDVLFVSADGFVLEAPTGSVVWSVGRTLRTTPTGASGILAGTTQRRLFERAAGAGWRVEDVPARVEDLHEADVVWIVSSVRGPIDVIDLDGKQRPRRPEVDAEIRRLAGF
jgi:4-amino-4-deoxychorismate lyase